MLRLQTPLPERYRDASAAELDAMIGAAKATLGERLFILGHHYQRDEVMKWADARGDSYRLSVLAQERPDADYIVFCGRVVPSLHRMAYHPAQFTQRAHIHLGNGLNDMADNGPFIVCDRAIGFNHIQQRLTYLFFLFIRVQ